MRDLWANAQFHSYCDAGFRCQKSGGREQPLAGLVLESIVQEWGVIFGKESDAMC
jgi:hypothetical protein